WRYNADVLRRITWGHAASGLLVTKRCRRRLHGRRPPDAAASPAERAAEVELGVDRPEPAAERVALGGVARSRADQRGVAAELAGDRQPVGEEGPVDPSLARGRQH